MAFANGELLKERDQLLAEKEILLKELGVLKSPDVVIQKARERGMIFSRGKGLTNCIRLAEDTLPCWNGIIEKTHPPYDPDRVGSYFSACWS